ncbi:hypothetical protein glysoja_020769 [Glycine soja]|nr:hypothetical protein glysoja_020769 [Glycine soja]
MGRNQREREKEEGEKHVGLLRLAQILTFLVVFAGGVVIGLTTSSHINGHFISQPYQYISLRNVPSPPPPEPTLLQILLFLLIWTWRPSFIPLTSPTACPTRSFSGEPP